LQDSRWFLEPSRAMMKLGDAQASPSLQRLEFDGSDEDCALVAQVVALVSEDTLAGTA
jgi:hypothetical protein